MYGVENEEVINAMEVFQAAEGIDIVPAAGVAVAALEKAVAAGAVKHGDTILLNITGGGEKRLGRERKTYDVEPRVVSKNISEVEIEKLLCDILKKN